MYVGGVAGRVLPISTNRATRNVATVPPLRDAALEGVPRTTRSRKQKQEKAPGSEGGRYMGFAADAFA